MQISFNSAYDRARNRVRIGWFECSDARKDFFYQESGFFRRVRTLAVDGVKRIDENGVVRFSNGDVDGEIFVKNRLLSSRAMRVELRDFQDVFQSCVIRKISSGQYYEATMYGLKNIYKFTLPTCTCFAQPVSFTPRKDDNTKAVGISSENALLCCIYYLCLDGRANS